MWKYLRKVIILNISFGNFLREKRRTAQLSQRDLAKIIGVDFSYISKVENDRMPPPSADTTRAIAKALQIPSSEFLALIGKIPTDVEKTIATNVEAQEFLQEIHTLQLSEAEWKEVRNSLSRLREEK